MKEKISLEEFIQGIPKAELHLHIEGTFEPELMFSIARRNKIKLKYRSVDELKLAYNFNNLQEFLDIYYEGAKVLINEEDFYDLTYSYFEKIHSQNVVHAEIFFDPQTHTSRGISFGTVISGIYKAMAKAHEKFGITSFLIMSFLRHLDTDSAMDMLVKADLYKDWIKGVGLDSSEAGNPPSKFTEVFDTARRQGYLLMAHAGEEGPPEYVKEAIDLLNVSRIDHGNRSLEDEHLVKRLVEKRIPLTICPLSNLKLKVVDDLKKHPLKYMINKGLFVTINSDDPAYFGGYLNENYLETAKALDLRIDEIHQLAKNSIHASFLNDTYKEKYLERIESYFKKHTKNIK